MGSQTHCSFATSLKSSLLGIAIAAAIIILGKIIYKTIKTFRSKISKSDSDSDRLALSSEDNTINDDGTDSPGILPMHNFLPSMPPVARFRRNFSRGGYSPLGSSVTTPGHSNSDMDRDIKYGIAHDQELQDLESAIPRYHAF